MMQHWWRAFAAMIALGLCCSRHCSARPMAKQSQQQQEQQEQPLHVSFAELKPTVSSIWIPSITTSAKTLQVPVSGLPGTPLAIDQMSRLVYTVTYKRRPAYVLQGIVDITPTAAFSSTDQQPIQQPLVTLRQNTQAASIPDSKVRCNSLMVAHGSSVSCTFSTTIFALDAPPPAGTAQALIRIPGTGTHVQTPPITYDFSDLAPASRLRLSSKDQMSDLLLNSVEKPPATTALVSNYFERGNDVILPTGISGVQPPSESLLTDTKTYTYTALFGDVPRNRCGKKWKVMATASIESTSDGLQPPETATSIADLELLGCDYLHSAPPSALHDCDEAGSAAPAPAAAAKKQNTADKKQIKAKPHKASVLHTAVQQSPAAAEAHTKHGKQHSSHGQIGVVQDPTVRPMSATKGKVHMAHNAAAAAAEFQVQLTVKQPPVAAVRATAEKQHKHPSAKPAAAHAAAAHHPRAASTAVSEKAAEAKGSIAVLERGSAKAAASQEQQQGGDGGKPNSSSSSSHAKRHIKEDGMVSTAALPANTFMAVQGSTLCGRYVCSPGQTCMDDAVCCDFGSSTCGGSCCPRGNICMNGRCMPPGSSTCGSTACSPSQMCLSGKCCDANVPTCGSTCCDGGQMCVNGQCAASGSSACGSRVCGPDQQCVTPGVCCAAGETQCGGSCCGGGNTCLNGQCVAGGSSLCAGQICGPGSVCADGAMCCPVGSSFCGGQCCGNGNQCVQGRCMAWGSTPCGGNVCNSDQSCQNGVCCNRGETGCGTGCCATGAGMQCLRNQCLPAGTQPCGSTTCPPGTACGDPYRSLCCAQGTRACAGSCCPADNVCSFRQTCVPWNSPEAGSGRQVDYIAGLEEPEPARYRYGYGNPYGNAYGKK